MQARQPHVYQSNYRLARQQRLTVDYFLAQVDEA